MLHPKPVSAPRIDAVMLDDLTDAAPSALRPHGSYEALAFASADDTHALEGADLPGLDLSECTVSGLDLSAARIIDSHLR